MWVLDYKESWAPKYWCFWTVVLKTLESPLDCKEIQALNPKGNQFWIFIGRTDVEAETPTLWALDAKNWLIWKDPAAGKDWRQEEKGMTEGEMVGWHHWFDAHEFEWTWELVIEQGGQTCCSPWVKRNQTRLSDWTELKLFCPSLCTCSSYSQQSHCDQSDHLSSAVPGLRSCFCVPCGSQLHVLFCFPGQFVHFRGLGSWEQWPLGCLVKHMRSNLHFLLGSQDGFWK